MDGREGEWKRWRGGGDARVEMREGLEWRSGGVARVERREGVEWRSGEVGITNPRAYS